MKISDGFKQTVTCRSTVIYSKYFFIILEFFVDLKLYTENHYKIWFTKRISLQNRFFLKRFCFILKIWIPILQIIYHGRKDIIK